jgi:hypothetical protein
MSIPVVIKPSHASLHGIFGLEKLATHKSSLISLNPA